MPDLDVGRRINMPGPVTFLPWPGQMTEVIRGHHLRYNEYLLVKVYNEEEARKYWGAAVIKPASGEDGEVVPAVSTDIPEDLAVGKHYVIKGTEVSFYMPPTGVSVVPINAGEYVRKALTLEVLEYSILVDEDGNKRYERGPNVVFPKPTEQFVEKNGRMKFRAIELNEIQGIHIKVIASYEHNGKEYKEGDELFITGKETAIYYPREEHSAVSYDGKTKHFATAVPVGEGRYVMDRMNGEIKMEKGPAMLLPDPRSEVIVRRVLTEEQCKLWYPGNTAALEHNRVLRGIAESVPTTRSGAVSDGDYERSTRMGKRSKKGMEASMVSKDQRAMMADEFSRASTYTQPRTVTLDTKFQGVPRVDIWTGYAVLVVSPTGERRVEIGPTTVQLDYDETLEKMALSTGKPKTTDDLYKTVYLRVANNNVSDIINDVETSDHVKLNIKVIHKVDFEDNPTRWWNIENYVKHICDHVRSVIKGAVKKISVEEFYANPIDITRDVILGKKEDGGERAGMSFENGARIKDVEVLKVDIQDRSIQNLLDQAQHQVVQTNIELAQAKRDLEVTVQHEKIAQDKAQAQDLIHVGQLTDVEAQMQVTIKEIENNQVVHDAKHMQNKEVQGLEIERLMAINGANIDRLNAIQPRLANAIQGFQEVIKLKSITEGFGELAIIDGKAVAEKAKEVLDLLPQNLRVHLDAGNSMPKRLEE
jgi:major vault protein